MSALEAVQAINDLIETSIMALDAANNSDTLCVYIQRHASTVNIIMSDFRPSKNASTAYTNMPVVSTKASTAGLTSTLK